MLKITSDGRKAALDLRLVGADDCTRSATSSTSPRTGSPDLGATPSDADLPRPETGEPHPDPGRASRSSSATSAPPPATGWNVYDELADQLVERGMPADQIRFIHEAKNDRAESRLFAACRDGRVAVLIGITEKMGVGTNVQDRAVALHHLDCPWRPADLEQRDGRIMRQGNQNPEVAILRYVTEGSFDGYIWQTVTRKAAFIAQIMRGRLDVARDRGHRRHRPVLRRGQSPGHRQPAAAGQGQSRRRAHPAGTAGTHPRPHPGEPAARRATE